MLRNKIFALSFYGLVLVFLLGGCGSSELAAPPGAVGRDATVALPTAIPASASTPVNTRVMPVEVLTPPLTATITPIPDEGRAIVVGIVDGHTVLVVLEGDSPNKVYVVRYLGIESPPPDDPWGAVVRETNRQLTNFKVVRLVRDETDFDNETTLPRYVYVNNQLLNVLLVEQGLARAAVNPPDTRFENEILAAEARAKAGKLGLWSGTPPTATSIPVVGTVESEGTPLLTVTLTISPEAVTPEVTMTATGDADQDEITATPPVTSTGTANSNTSP